MRRARCRPLEHARDGSRHGDDRRGARRTSSRVPTLSRSRKSTRRATTNGTRVPSVASAAIATACAVCACTMSIRRVRESPRRSRHAARRIELATRAARDDLEPSPPPRARPAARRCRAATDGPWPRRASSRGEPQRLSLAAAPSALRVDVQHVDRHARATSDDRTSRSSARMHDVSRIRRRSDRRARQPRRSRVRVGAHAAAARGVSRRDDRRLVQGIHGARRARSFRTSRP